MLLSPLCTPGARARRKEHPHQLSPALVQEPGCGCRSLMAVGAPRGACIQSLKGGDMGQDPGDGRKLPQPPDPSRWVIGLVLGSVESCKKQQFVSLRHRCQLRGLALGWRGGVR